MYNLCSERTYDSSLFGGDGVVHRFMIDDHNVPSLSEMVRFSKDVGEWLAADKENVIVVHCKVGRISSLSPRVCPRSKVRQEDLKEPHNIWTKVQL